MANQKPVDEIRIGRVKATIWRNGTDEQPRHNVTFGRLYKEADQLLTITRMCVFLDTRR